MARIDADPTPGTEARETRLAENEVLFRSVNEGIEEQAIRFGGDGYEFLCECASRVCLERVALTLHEYEHIRAEATRFFVVPGHENAEVESVVATAPHYYVVEKNGAAAIVADLTDPRDGGVTQH